MTNFTSQQEEANKTRQETPRAARTAKLRTPPPKAGNWDSDLLTAGGKSASTLGTSLALPPRAEPRHAPAPGRSFLGWHPACGVWARTATTRHARAQAALSARPHPTNGATGRGPGGVWASSQVCCAVHPCVRIPVGLLYLPDTQHFKTMRTEELGLESVSCSSTVWLQDAARARGKERQICRKRPQ